MSGYLIQPPHAIEAEESVLGGLMLQPGSLPLIADWLEEKDFYLEQHRLLFRSIVELTEKGQPVDAVTMCEWAENSGVSEVLGGPSAILKLANATPSAANIVAYGEIVAEKSRLRQEVDVFQDAAGRALKRGADSQLIAAEVMHELSQFQAKHVRGGLQSVRALGKQWIAELNARYQLGHRITGMSSPWPDLDALTHGFQNGDLIIVAARPNMGKTVAGLNQALHACLSLKKRVALFSLEMTSAKVMNRNVAAVGRVPHDWVMAPTPGGDEDVYWPRVTEAMRAMSSASLLIDDTPALTVTQIVARARRANLQQPLQLVVIDHLHIVRGASRGGRSENRSREIGEMTQAFKALAKELNCPVVVLAQLNRANTQRTDRRPTMGDLRDSGEIEQDADMILFLHREDYYLKDKTPDYLRGVVEMEIGKGRDVKTGERIYLQNRFDEMRLDPWEGPTPSAPVADEYDEHRSSRSGFGRKRRSGGSNYRTGTDG